MYLNLILRKREKAKGGLEVARKGEILVVWSLKTLKQATLKKKIKTKKTQTKKKNNDKKQKGRQRRI